MIKKLALIVGGGVLVLSLLFGTRLIPYAKTSFHKVRQAAREAVPISMLPCTQLHSVRSRSQYSSTPLSSGSRR